MKPTQIAATTAALVATCVAAPLLAQQQPDSRPSASAADSLRQRASESRIKGSADAPVTIVEVSDYQCPFCRRFAEQTMPALDSAYIQTGKVRMLFLNYPLPNHPLAWVAAEAALCAGAQGEYWRMHDLLFTEQEVWAGSDDPVPILDRYAERLGLRPEEFQRCTRGDAVAAIIIGDLLQAAGANIRGTPTFIINGSRLLSGALTFEQISAEIEAELAAEEQ